MRRRNGTIPEHHLSVIRRRFEYDIYRGTDNTIGSGIASFMKRLLYGGLAEPSQGKIFYKEMKIYFFDQSPDGARMSDKTLQYSQLH